MNSTLQIICSYCGNYEELSEDRFEEIVDDFVLPHVLDCSNCREARMIHGDYYARIVLKMKDE